jgi:O-antigen ligase
VTTARLSRPVGIGLVNALALAVGAAAVAALLGYVAGAAPIVAIAGAGAALLAIAIAIRPDVATLVVAGILYSNAAVIAVQFHGVPYFMAAAVPLLLVAPLGYVLIVRRMPVVATSAMPLIVVYFFVMTVSAVFSGDPTDAFSEITTFVLEGIGLFFMITNVVRSIDVLKRVVWVLLVVGALLGALSLYQQVTRTFANNYGGFAQLSQAVFDVGTSIVAPDLQPRLAGPIGEKNRYAQVMLMLVPLGLFWAVNSRRTVVRAATLVMTGLIAVGVALTFSRGAAVGFLLVGLLMLGLGYIRPSQLLLLGLGVVATFLIVPSYLERLGSIANLANVVSGASDASNPDGSILSRVTEGLAALLAFADHPILGVGPGLFPTVYRHYADLVGIRVLAADREAHDLYVGIAAETGLPGLLTFLGIMWLTLRDLVRARRRWVGRNPELANIATAFLLSEATYLATAIFLHMAYERYFWLMLALAAVAGYLLLRLPEPDGLPETGPSSPPANVPEPVPRPGIRGRLPRLAGAPVPSATAAARSPVEAAAVSGRASP